MAETVKVLAQGTFGNIQNDVYACPSVGGAVISTLYVCNRTGGTIHFRISIAPAGIPDDVEQYIYYDIALPPNETFASTTGISLAQTDAVRAVADVSGCSISLFGVERT